MNRKPSRSILRRFPEFTLLVLSLCLFGAVLCFQILKNQPLYNVSIRHWGNDFRFFFHAGQLFAAGESPYLEHWFTSPPPTAALFSLVSGLTFEQAYISFFFFTLLGCLAAYVGISRTFLGTQKLRSFTCALACIAVAITGFPFQFLLDRGNIDGLMLVLIAISLFALDRRKDVLAGAIIGMAGALKIYPLLLIGALCATRRWRAMGAAIGMFAAAALVTATNWAEFLPRVLGRHGDYRVDENASLSCLISHLSYLWSGGSEVISPDAASRWGSILFLLLATATLGIDFWRRQRTPENNAKRDAADVLLYAPLMVSFPSLTFCYELVLPLAALPAALYIAKTTPKPTTRSAMLLITSGLALSQFQTVALYQMWKVPSIHILPSLGNFLVIIGALLLKAPNRLDSNRCAASPKL